MRLMVEDFYNLESLLQFKTTPFDIWWRHTPIFLKLGHDSKGIHINCMNITLELDKLYLLKFKVQFEVGANAILSYSKNISFWRDAIHNLYFAFKFTRNTFDDLELIVLKKLVHIRKFHFTFLEIKTSKIGWEKHGKTAGKVPEGLPNLIFLNNSKSQLFLNSYANNFFLRICNCMPLSLKCKSIVNVHDLSLKKNFRKYFNINKLEVNKK